MEPLNRNAVKTLKAISRKGSITITNPRSKNLSTHNHLLSLGYVSKTAPTHNPTEALAFSITEKGRDVLKNERKLSMIDLRSWIAIGLSIIATGLQVYQFIRCLTR